MNGAGEETGRQRHAAKDSARASKLLPLLIMVMFLMSSLVVVTSLSTDNALIGGRGGDHRAKVLGATPPEIYTGNVSGNSKEQVTVSIYIFDADDDPVHIEWEWGDGTPNGTSDVTGTSAYPEVVSYHTWNGSIPGMGEVWVDFTMNITATDIDNNAVTTSVIVGIWVPYNNYPNVAILTPVASVDPGLPVDIVANATDFEGEPLTWTFVFNNSVEEYETRVFYSGWSEPNATVWNNVTATFPDPGNYTVRMFVSDALPGEQVGIHNNSVKSGTIRVVLNRLPYTTGVITTDPNTLEINATLGALDVMFSVETLDMDGDLLNITWDFHDGSALAYNETTGGKDAFRLSQIRTITETGQLNVTVTISDGSPGHIVYVYGLFNFTSNNLPPFARVGFTYIGGNFALPNETIQFTMTVSDPEEDEIQVIVDFGDNTTLGYYNLTDYVNGNATLAFQHSYELTGSYTISIWYSDNILGFGQHEQVYNLTIDVSVPIVPPSKTWTWWDFTSLALFSMIPVLIFVNIVRIQRKRRFVEKEGMSLEEWKVRQSELKRARSKNNNKGG